MAQALEHLDRIRTFRTAILTDGDAEVEKITKACDLLGWLGVGETEESTSHEVHIGYARREIICDEWDKDAYIVYMAEYTSPCGSSYRIGIHVRAGTLKPFEDDSLQFGGPYEKYLEHNVDFELDLVTRETVVKIMGMVAA